jgi:F-type H+-transporting ATPase subunit b
VDVLAVAADLGRGIIQLTQEGEATETLFQINVFWVIVSGLSFLVFFAVLWTFAFKPTAQTLNDRRDRIEQGLKDAEQARLDRESAETERLATLADARREANDILARAQRVAQETRDADIAATREELERMRGRALEEIESEKGRAVAELRSEVADLAIAAASRVVGESLTGERQRRLVDEFLTTLPSDDGSRN